MSTSGPSRRRAVVRMSPMVRQDMSRWRLRAVCGAVAILAAAACGSEDSPSNGGFESSPVQTPAGSASSTDMGEDDTWGPLTVIEDTGTEFALAPRGVLRITATCTYLETSDRVFLLLWPEGRTTWDAATRRITFTNLSGDEVELRSGQRIQPGGGGTSLEGPEAENGDGNQWVAPPHRSCVMIHQWRVGGIVDD